MSTKNHHIFLISFEQDTLDAVLNCVREAFFNLNDQGMTFDFSLVEIVSSAEDGVVFKVKNKADNRTCLMHYHATNTDGLVAQYHLLNSVQCKAPAVQQGCIVYCFDSANLKNGYGPFEHVGNTEYLKFQQTDYLLSHAGIRSYNLVYFAADEGEQLTDFFDARFFANNEYIDGENLSGLFNGQKRRFGQYSHFLKLPTYIVINNQFKPKIPF